jgi:hypothetical protein
MPDAGQGRNRDLLLELRCRLRLVHDGSTTDESAVQVVMPGRGLAIVLLTNGQSVLYELFRKTTTIGYAAAAKLAGLPATGTLEAFYLVFDIAALALIAVMVRGLGRAVIAAYRGRAQSRSSAAPGQLEFESSGCTSTGSCHCSSCGERQPFWPRPGGS